MKILPATPYDVEKLVELYEQARLKMKEFGNPNQWVNGYPSREVILNDIKSESLYLCLEGETQVKRTATIILMNETGDNQA